MLETVLATPDEDWGTFPKPGTRVKRIIIEIDLAGGGHAALRFPGTAIGGAVNLDGDTRIVFNVV
ncbi:MAG TPA: hypothetical protein VGV87_23480 [Blastocatellia bacterium]|jgi:hypothetical protein|nr:hypothetical protein [Blastocatellia bacterium]